MGNEKQRRCIQCDIEALYSVDTAIEKFGSLYKKQITAQFSSKKMCVRNRYEYKKTKKTTSLTPFFYEFKTSWFGQGSKQSTEYQFTVQVKMQSYAAIQYKTYKFTTVK